MTYVLVGGPFQVLDTPFSGEAHVMRCALGHPFEMPEDVAGRAIRHGAGLVPPEMFEAFGFTAAELAAHPNSRLRAKASPEFLAKYDSAMQAFHEYRAGLLLAAQEE